MNRKHPHLSLLRVVLEATTPLSIGTGAGDLQQDVVLARDHNDLPTLPGTAIAGVLRHLARTLGYDKAAVESLFGPEVETLREPPTDTGLLASRLNVSHGLIHDFRDIPVERLLPLADIAADPLLALAVKPQPGRRDHVRLNQRGVVDQRGKFERSLLPAGYRFTVEFALWSETVDDAAWAILIALIGDPRFRLGGATRRGYGGMAVARAHHRRFDLRDAVDFQDFSQLNRSLEDTPLSTWQILAMPTTALARLAWTELTLTPTDFWRFGQGEKPLGQYGAEKLPDLLQVTGTKVCRSTDGKAQLRFDQIVIPASALKGALAHRFAFHYNRHRGYFIDGDDQDQSLPVDDANDGVKTLFGYVAQDGAALAGLLVIDDALLLDDTKVAPVRLTHNAIDRFTGGVRAGFLYSEEVLNDGRFKLVVTLLDCGDSRLSQPGIRAALDDTLADLCEGRLPLGGGVNKGHGSVTGTRGPWSLASWGRETKA